MKKDYNGRNLRKWTILLLATLTVTVIAWGVFSQSDVLRGQSTSSPAPVASPVFTPAHATFADAVSHFFGLRPEPVQPIPYVHRVHIEKAQLACDFCHVGVAKGPNATIPGVKTCMTCHEFIATEKPAIQQVAAYYKRGEDIPWQRVYGWNAESHVRFNHAPHIRAQVDCATCHGNVPQMTVAQRVVDHTMDFCMACHKQKQVSNDCLTCHY